MSCPLLEGFDLRNARGVLVNIAGSEKTLGDAMRVTVVADDQGPSTFMNG